MRLAPQRQGAMVARVFGEAGVEERLLQIDLACAQVATPPREMRP